MLSRKTLYVRIAILLVLVAASASGCSACGRNSDDPASDPGAKTQAVAATANPSNTPESPRFKLRPAVPGAPTWGYTFRDAGGTP